MNSSFENIDAQLANESDGLTAKSVEAAVPPTTVAVPEQHALVTDDFFANGGVEGEVDQRDVKIPGFNIVQAVGPLSEHFEAGKMVYNKDTVLDAPAEFTLLKIKKYYSEVIPYGSEIRPRLFDTEAQARAAGLFPQWEKKSAPEEAGFFRPVLDCMILLHGDKAKHDLWPYEFGNRVFTLARWIIQSTAYSTAAQLFITQSQFSLRKGLHTGFWKLTPKREKVGVNMVWIPRPVLAGKHTDEFVKWIEEQLGKTN